MSSLSTLSNVFYKSTKHIWTSPSFQISFSVIFRSTKFASVGSLLGLKPCNDSFIVSSKISLSFLFQYSGVYFTYCT
jgi:hypothetical protein